MPLIVLWLVLASASISCSLRPSRFEHELFSPLSELPTPGLDECSAAWEGVSGIDVGIVIDRSASTLDPAGHDIDRDGEVGMPALRRIGSIYSAGSTDPDDSILVAQVVAAHALVRGLAGRDVRFAIVSYCGAEQPPRETLGSECLDSPEIEAGLTGDLIELEDALSRVLARSGAGHTDFGSGMRGVLVALAEGEPESRESVALFLSDSPTPVLPSKGKSPLRSDPLIQEAVQAATRAGVVFHTFGLGNAAKESPPFALSQMAGATGGSFRPVANASRLHCHFSNALTR